MDALSDLLTEHCPFVCSDRNAQVLKEHKLRYMSNVLH